MIDNILCFPTKEDCPFPLKNSPSWWDGKYTFMPVEIIIQDGEMDPDWDGPEPRWIIPKINGPGWWLIIRSDERDQWLEEQPFCLLVVDPIKGAKEEPFIYISKLAPDTPLGKIQPTFSGDQYHFPEGTGKDLEPWIISNDQIIPSEA